MNDRGRRRLDNRFRTVGRLTVIAILAVIAVGAACRLVYGFLPIRVAAWLTQTVAEPLRRRVLDPTTIARRIGIRSGMRVLLVGSNDGSTAEAIARDVGDAGQVAAFARDVKGADRARAYLSDAGVKNVQVVTGPIRAVPFDDDSFDAVCLLCALGRPTDPREVLAEAWRVLRPSGRLSASDVISDPAYRRRHTVERLGEGVGFESLEHFGNVLAYTINFRKPLTLGASG